MMQECPKCQTCYDDARCLTFCPHEMLMPAEDLERKSAALDLVIASPYVRFNHLTDKDRMRIIGITWNGMVMLHELPGEFAPHLFVSLPEREP